MSFGTLFEETSLGVAASAAFSAVVPDVASAVGAVARAGPRSEVSADDRVVEGADVWVDCHERSGVVSIHDPRLFRPGREAFCRALADLAIGRCQVRRVEICLTSSVCRLEFQPGEFGRAELACRVAEAVSAASPVIRDRAGATRDPRATWTTLTEFATDAWMPNWETHEDRSGPAVLCDAPTPTNQPATALKGSSRLADLVLTGGSLTMAVAGAILPGIPALPFLMLGVRHAVRLSPNIHHFLRRRTWLAPIFSDAEASGNLLQLDRRSLMWMLPIIVVATVVLLIVHPPWPVVIALEIGVMALVCLRGAIEQLGDREVALGLPA
jgi:uncharacterized membrane protein YbaN (DUF454 family)